MAKPRNTEAHRTAQWVAREHCEKLLDGPGLYKEHEWRDLQRGTRDALDALAARLRSDRTGAIRHTAQSLVGQYGDQTADVIARRIQEALDTMTLKPVKGAVADKIKKAVEAMNGGKATDLPTAGRVHEPVKRATRTIKKAAKKKR